MQRALMVAAMMLGSVSAAAASSHYETTYHDNIRLSGHLRSQDAALDACQFKPACRAPLPIRGVQGLHGTPRLSVALN